MVLPGDGVADGVEDALGVEEGVKDGVALPPAMILNKTICAI